MNTLGPRIELIINKLGYNKNSFSKKLGYKNNTQIGEYINGTTPRVDFFEKLVQAFPGIDLNWLVTGEGEPFKAEASKAATAEATDAVQPNEFRDWIKDLRSQVTHLQQESKIQLNIIAVLSSKVGAPNHA